MWRDKSELVACGLHPDDQRETVSPSPTSQLHQGALIRLPSALCKPPLRTYFNWDDTGNDDYARRPKLLDLFAGAGGSALGYYLAGFQIVGVDNRPQKRYPFEFVLADALEYVAEHGDEFDAIHASPPCQRYSRTRHLARKDHPMLIEPTRCALRSIDRPYVLENVPGAPLIDPIILTGTMFGLRVVRKRLFECSFPITQPFMPQIPTPHAKMGRLAKPDQYIHVAGRGGVRGVLTQWKEAMAIDWMTCTELAQAIPPAYTKFVGQQLLRYLNEPTNDSCDCQQKQD